MGERDKMTVDILRRLKEERGYSVKKLSELSGVPVGTIQKIFTGETRCPRYDTLMALQKVFDEPLCVREPEAAFFNDFRKAPGEYTTKDYASLPEDRRVQLIDGVFYDMTAPLLVHQAVIAEVIRHLSDEIKKNNGTCLVFAAPVDVKLGDDDRTMVQPDVTIVCDRSKLRRWGIQGAPDFILEVLSPGSRKLDMVTKLAKYRSSGVREYWMLDIEGMKLITCDIAGGNECRIMELDGEAGLSIYDSRITIDLSEIARLIQMYEDLE